MAKRIVFIVAALILSACGARQSVLITDNAAQVDAATEQQAAELATKAAALWAERGDRAKAEAAVQAWAEAGQLNPNDADIQRNLTYAHYFMNNVHVRWDENEDLEKANYDLGAKAALRALKAANPVFASKIVSGEDTDKVWEEALAAATPEDVPALYWYATNLAKWALKEGIGSLLKYKDRALMIMRRCKELNSDYWHGGPARYLGAYWLKIPFGKSPEKSQENFQISMKSSPGYLDTKVLYAEIYAVRTGDEELFKSTLQEVVDSADDVHPDLIPENKNARRVAAEMLENAEDYF